MSDFDPVLEKWLTLGADWQNNLLAQGIAHISPSSCQKIQRWSQYAVLLGFQQQAELAADIIDADRANQQKSAAFYTLIVQQELYQQLYNAAQLKRDYLNENEVV